jgi:hypothetical protein
MGGARRCGRVSGGAVGVGLLCLLCGTLASGGEDPAREGLRGGSFGWGEVGGTVGHGAGSSTKQHP